MKRFKWYEWLILGLCLMSLVTVAACTESKKKVPAPDFTLQSMDGNFVSLSDFRGRPVMLTFWRINCSACQFQLPFTQELFDKWSSDSLVVLTINISDRAADIKDYMTSRKATYPVLLDTQGEVTQSYGLLGVPTTFFIDAEGFIKAYQVGAFQNENAMETAISKAFPNLVLSPKLQTSTDILNTPKIESGPEVGSVAPDFTLQTIHNQNMSLSELRGKTVLLNFWMSTCDACVSELPYLQTASDNQSSKQVVILTVNCGESNQAVHSVVDKLNPTFPVLLDPDGTVCTAYKRGAPTAFLIDGSGIIKAIKDDAFESPEEVDSMLDSLD
jgi:peroxiredoxin